ncbi:hypothetical protein L208DRAFT_127023 [Tricholoma matsutake]|nr:hypothetical protein L208DRAFT_127023 [Tricholoma matsutake 945]
MAKLTKLNDIELTVFPGEPDSTPTTWSIPTPDIDDDVALITVRNPGWEPDDGERIRVPDTPRMKDLDSFTEGTGQGSFDSIPAASTNEYGEPIHAPNALSLDLLPVADLNQSVELWRNEVFIDDPPEPYTITDTEDIVDVTDFDDIDGMSEMTLMSPNQERCVERPRMSLGIATSSSDIAIHSVDPRIKRARSSSPDFARRTRPRSQSLISMRSASAFTAPADMLHTPLILSVPQCFPHMNADPPD